MWLGLAVWVAGFTIEALTDEQKRQFRAAPRNHGEFIDTGLWAYSRHPNYFGEILLWCGVLLMSVTALRGWQWIGVISPIFVTFLLTRVSGIPLLEKKAQKRWGNDPSYQQYKARTPILVPRLRK